MSNIHNFTNRQLCEYQSIFPTVAALLDHLLFTIGNGYEFDPEWGLPYYDGGRGPRTKPIFIDKYPRMTPKRWEKLIVDCHAKELEWHIQWNSDTDRVESAMVRTPELVDFLREDKERREKRLTEKCAKYKPVSVSDDDFTEEAFYQDLRDMVEERIREKHYWMDEVMLRPYPLSENYAKIYKLNEKTPKWFLQIGLNLCRAWVRFLNEELAAGNVWTKPESNYADLTWTTKHRDMLVDLVQKLEGLVQNAKI